MSKITLHHGDNRETLRRLIDQGVRVHSVVTDPPYGLTSITKRFGKDGAAKAKFGSDGAFARASAGFMGSKWDGTGIERDPEFWRLIHDILLPGGYVVAFSGSRTGHWQACAMEMAGFIMHPFLGWVYGSGFPKAHNAAKAIDRELKTTGTYEGTKPGHAGFEGRDTIASLRAGGAHAEEGGFSRPWMADADAVNKYHMAYTPGSPEAAQWDGWAYGGQALKPALEPIFVGQKPFSEKNGALNLLKHGVGAINIDGCRVEAAGVTNLGRHPTNLLHDGSDDVVALFPQSKGQQGKSSDATRSQVHTYGAVSDNGKTYEPRNDTGSAARFFNSFPTELCDRCGGTGQIYFGGSLSEDPWIDACPVCLGESARPLDADPIRYQSKATKADRAGSKHPTVKPVSLMEWLVTLVTPPGGTVLDPFAGSGTTGQAAHNLGFDCVLMEAEDQFAADIRRRFSLPAPVADDDFDSLISDDFDDLLQGVA